MKQIKRALVAMLTAVIFISCITPVKAHAAETGSIMISNYVDYNNNYYGNCNTIWVYLLPKNKKVLKKITMDDFSSYKKMKKAGIYYCRLSGLYDYEILNNIKAGKYIALTNTYEIYTAGGEFYYATNNKGVKYLSKCGMKKSIAKKLLNYTTKDESSVSVIKNVVIDPHNTAFLNVYKEDGYNAKDLYEYDGYDVLLYDTIYTSNYYNAYGNDSEDDEYYEDDEDE